MTVGQRETLLCFYSGVVPNVWKKNWWWAKWLLPPKKKQRKLWVHPQLILNTSINIHPYSNRCVGGWIWAENVSLINVGNKFFRTLALAPQLTMYVCMCMCVFPICWSHKSDNFFAVERTFYTQKHELFKVFLLE
jgi:hypothetical protein